MSENIVTLKCTCSSKDHDIQFTVDTWGGSSELFVVTHLSPEASFFKRMWTAIKYTFNGTTCKYGYTTECIPHDNDIKRLKSLIEEYERRKKEEDV